MVNPGAERSCWVGYVMESCGNGAMAEWQTQPTQNRLRTLQAFDLGVQVPLALPILGTVNTCADARQPHRTSRVLSLLIQSVKLSVTVSHLFLVRSGSTRGALVRLAGAVHVPLGFRMASRGSVFRGRRWCGSGDKSRRYGLASQCLDCSGSSGESSGMLGHDLEIWGCVWIVKVSQCVV